MAEGLETGAAMIGPHAAVADATEGKLAVDNLHDGVVDAGAARRGVLYHVAGPFAAAGKVVEGQRFLAQVDVLDTVVDVVERNYGEYGSENFVGEQGRLRVDVGKQRRGYVAVGRVAGAAAEGSTMREQSRQSLEMPRVDNARIVGVVLRVLAELPHDFPAHQLDEVRLYPAVHQQIIGRYASLSAVQEFAPHDTAGSRGQVGVVVDNTGTLAPQLERDRREVSGSCLHDVVAILHAAGIEDVVEPLLQQLLGRLAPVIGYGDVLLFETFANEFLQGPSRVGRFARGLDDGTVAGRDGTHQRRQRQLQRVVPRGNDEHTPVRLVMNAAVRAEEEERRGAPAVASPTLQVVFDDAYLVQKDTDFGYITFERRLAQVGPQSLGQLFFPVGNSFGQAVEGTQTVGDFAGNMFVEECFLQIDQVMIVVRCHIVVVCNWVIKITIRRQIQFKIILNSCLSRYESIIENLHGKEIELLKRP